MVDEEKKQILSFWQKATEYNTKEIAKLKEEYNVKFIDCDEDSTKFEHMDTSKMFQIATIGDWDEDLNEEEQEFVDKYERINEDSFDIFEKEMKKAGYSEWDTDETASTWVKGDKQYYVPYYAKEIGEIDADCV